ncbi:MAG: hypothetical protein K2N01_00300 [Lachnospiraceae bacterium]|nr:hypothetical protein [Lachnospiraceae bacterium]
MIYDSQQLTRVVGEEAFYGDVLSAGITFQNGIINMYEQRIASLKQNRKWLRVLGMPFQWVDRAITGAEEVIRCSQNLIADYRMRIDRAQWIISSTGSLFQYAQTLYVSVEQGIAELEQGGISGTSGISSGWRQTLSGAWEKRMQEIEVKSRRYLSNAGFTEHQLQTAAELGYSYEEVKNLWIQFGDTQDREFFQHLMDGNVEGYEAAFQINPLELSDAMTLVLSDYAYRLLQAEKIQSLTEFNNAVLSADHMIIDENGTVLSFNYADKYLERLVLGSAMQVQGDLVCVAAVNPADDTGAYNALYQMYEKKFALMSLWTTESAVIQQLKRQEFNEAVAMSVEALEIDGMDLSFRLNHLSQGEMVAEEIKIKSIETGLGLDMEWDEEEIRQAEENRARVLERGIINILESIGLLALGTFSPESAIFASVALMLLEGAPKTVTGLDGLAESQMGKLGIKSANTAVNSIVNTYLSYLNAEEQLEDKKYKVFMKWFGSGVKYEVSGGSLEEKEDILICGLYNPKTLYYMNEWNENGVRGWGNWSEETCDRIEEAIKADESEDERIRSNALALLNGSSDSERELDICKLNPKDILEAVGYIEEIDISEELTYKSEDKVKTKSIKLMWENINEELQ